MLQNAGTHDGPAPKSDSDAQAAWKPSEQRFMDNMINHVRQAAGIVRAKATPQELEDFKRMVLWMAERVASADKERGSDTAITSDEQRVLDEIKAALNRKA